MATAYKTPGVYVEEIPKFPPSIAPVETAIPVFIGYTEKALRNNEKLEMKPTRIESIAEYELLFGIFPPQNLEVYLDTDDRVVGAKAKKGFLLYDSLRMFYGNGGGNCYIVSVGNYNATLDKSKLVEGINAVAIEDEPTMLLFPDAASLTGNELHDVQIEALMQCNKLKDRVTLCDTKNSGNFKDDVKALRDTIGINNLKYGMAYGPWINTSLPRFVYHRSITLKRNDTSGTAISLKQLATETAVKQVLADVEDAEKAVDTLRHAEEEAAGAGKTWADEFKKRSDTYSASADTTLAGLQDELRNMYDLLARTVASVRGMTNDLPTEVTTGSPNPDTNQTADFKLKSDLSKYIETVKVKSDIFNGLAQHYNYLRGATTGNIKIFTDDPAADETANPTNPTTNLLKSILLLGYTDAAAFLGTNFPDSSNPYAAATDEMAKANIARDAAVKASSTIIAFFRFAQASAAEYEKKFNEALLTNFSVYKSIVNKATEQLNLLPPSGAIAGVYSAVDRERGVWKAPANVSLNMVIAPAEKISQDQQAEYNIDVNAGKSINIIRAFTGKGTLVWGARTLAGNDNEWRYVSVRRFFNFVEESVKKATEQFVFEPNDANTWVKVQAMIENFLTTLWRQGALQGIKPEHAFYVAVGLGKTMTALDILEGRMVVEIGMAAVRPAEFIILKFSHKMAES